MAQDFLDNVSSDDKKKITDAIVDQVKENEQGSTKRQLAKAKKQDSNKKSTGNKSQNLSAPEQEDNQDEMQANKLDSDKKKPKTKKDQKTDSPKSAGQPEDKEFKDDDLKIQGQDTAHIDSDAVPDDIDQDSKELTGGEGKEAEAKPSKKDEAADKGERKGEDKTKENQPGDKDQNQEVAQPEGQQKEDTPQNSEQAVDPNLQQGVNKVAPEQEQEAGRKFNNDQIKARQEATKQASQAGKEGAGLPSDEDLKGMSSKDIMRHYRDIRQQAEEKGSSAVGGSIKGAAYQGAQMGTAYLLKAAWQNVPDTIVAYGGTLWYVEIHFICRYILSLAIPQFKDIFCRMGEEWSSTGKAEKLGKLSEAASKSGGSNLLEFIEVGGLIVLNLIIFSIIMMILGIIVLIVDAIEHPWDLDKLWILTEGLKPFWQIFH